MAAPNRPIANHGVAPREIELKLEIDPADVGALKSHPRLEALPSRTLTQVSTYYDTEGEALRRAGYTLRVRQAGNRLVQTVKGEVRPAGAMFDRAEWECEIGGSEPDLGALSRTPAACLIDAKEAQAGLVSLFTAAVERTVWRVNDMAGAFELILDQGEILANGKRAPICEVELELLDGEPRALFALGRQFAMSAPLRIGVLSKFERGLMLRDDALGKPFKAFPAPVARGMTAGAAFAAIAAACIRQFRLNEPLFAHDRDGGALHQARVAMRRLRSAWAMFAAIASDEQRGEIGAGLRWISSILGEARDLDVLVNKRLPPDYADAELRAIALAERESAFDRAIAALGSPRFQILMFDIAEWLAFGAWRAADAPARGRRDQQAEHFAEEVLDQLWRKVRKRGRKLADLDDDSRHELRIAAKKLRYGSEFFAALFAGDKTAKRRKAFLAALEELQDHLGDLNDIVTAHQFRDRFPGLDDPGHAPDRAALIAGSEQAFARLAEAGPFWR